MSFCQLNSEIIKYWIFIKYSTLFVQNTDVHNLAWAMATLVLSNACWCN